MATHARFGRAPCRDLDTVRERYAKERRRIRWATGSAARPKVWRGTQSGAGLRPAAALRPQAKVQKKKGGEATCRVATPGSDASDVTCRVTTPNNAWAKTTPRQLAAASLDPRRDRLA